MRKKNAKNNPRNEKYSYPGSSPRAAAGHHRSPQSDYPDFPYFSAVGFLCCLKDFCLSQSQAEQRSQRSELLLVIAVLLYHQLFQEHKNILIQSDGFVYMTMQ